MRFFVATVAALLLFASTAQAQDRRIQGESRIGCVSRDYYEKLVSFAASGDNEAFKKALVAGVMTEQCTMFQAGASVILEDTAMFSGMMKIRVRGETTSYWTSIESAK